MNKEHDQIYFQIAINSTRPVFVSEGDNYGKCHETKHFVNFDGGFVSVLLVHDLTSFNEVQSYNEVQSGGTIVS